jgi:NAD(P)-dependent dehydrogenase (short-subunit alcohol dehydrogenase family)
MPDMLIGTGTLTRQSLAGQIAVVTGAGGGIGFEAARALVWLGAHVVIAEIDKSTGKDAATRLNEELGEGAVTFIQTDVGDEHSVNRMARQTLHSHGKVDIVLNNATIAPLGAVQEVPIKDWDASYRVNLRGPVLLAQAFLPGMLERDYGVFVCVSSVGMAYMGAYEIFKTAQVELANTLDAELEGTGVIAFTIGPGMVPTATAQAGIEQIAPLYGKTVAEFYAMVEDQIISVEAAGAGFAAAIALADCFRGQEIASILALQTAGIELPEEERKITGVSLTSEEFERILTLCRQVRATLVEQSEGWKQRSVFEQQYMLRAFKKQAGMPVEQWLEALESLEHCAEARDAGSLAAVHAPLGALVRFYEHLYGLADGYLKDPAQREEQLQIVRGWQEDAERLKTLVEEHS